MEKNLVKYLSSVALIAMTFGFTACSAMKPDHPQVRESFSERRAPRDNMLAASGAFGDKKEKTSAFQPITPTSVVENSAAPITQAVSQVTFSQPVSTGVAEPQSSLGNSSAGDTGFFSRFVDKISSSFKTSSNDVIKRQPKASAYAMNANYSDVEQGSKMGYSFYDLADEILPSNPVHRIVHQEIPSLTSEKSLVKNTEFGYISSPNRIVLAQADTMPVLPVVPSAAPVPPAVESNKNVAPAPSQPAAPQSVPPVVAPSTATASVDSKSATTNATQTSMPAAPVVQPPAMPTVTETKVVPQAPEMPSTNPAPAAPAVTAPVVQEATPSKPLTDVPATPSMSDLKEKTQQQPEPQIKDTPKVPEEFKSSNSTSSSDSSISTPTTEEPAKVTKPKPKKVAKKFKLPKEESRDPVAMNPNSQTIYMMNGKKVTTGFLDNSNKN